MPGTIETRDFVPPKNTGSDLVDRAFIDLSNIISSIKARLDDLDRPVVAKVTTADLFQIKFETVIVYLGPNGGKVLLPPASFFSGTRSRVLWILIPTNAGTVTAICLPGDLINTFTSQSFSGGKMIIFRSDGDKNWSTEL